jgi:hypothetical protein
VTYGVPNMQHTSTGPGTPEANEQILCKDYFMQIVYPSGVHLMAKYIKLKKLIRKTEVKRKIILSGRDPSIQT